MLNSFYQMSSISDLATSAKTSLSQTVTSYTSSNKVDQLLIEITINSKANVTTEKLLELADETHGIPNCDKIADDIIFKLQSPPREYKRIVKCLQAIIALMENGSPNFITKVQIGAIAHIGNLTRFEHKMDMIDKGEQVRRKAMQILDYVNDPAKLNKEREAALEHRKKFYPNIMPPAGAPVHVNPVGTIGQSHISSSDNMASQANSMQPVVGSGNQKTFTYGKYQDDPAMTASAPTKNIYTNKNVTQPGPNPAKPKAKAKLGMMGSIYEHSDFMFTNASDAINRTVGVDIRGAMGGQTMADKAEARLFKDMGKDAGRTAGFYQGISIPELNKEVAETVQVQTQQIPQKQPGFAGSMKWGNQEPEQQIYTKPVINNKPKMDDSDEEDKTENQPALMQVEEVQNDMNLLDLDAPSKNDNPYEKPSAEPQNAFDFMKPPTENQQNSMI